MKKNATRILSVMMVVIMICAIPMTGLAAGTANISSSSWNNTTKTKNITVKFSSSSYDAGLYDVKVTIWYKVGPGGTVRTLVSNSPIYIGEDGGVTWGSRAYSIPYGRVYGTSVSRSSCYYKYKVTYTINGKTGTARSSDWIKA